MQNILLYGGSFDPPHLGHLECLKLALRKNIFDKIILVPTGDARYDKTVITESSVRLEMLNIFLKENFLESDCVEIDTIQLDGKLQKGSATIDLIDYYISLNPENKYCFLIGSDNLKILNTWKEIDRLKKIVHFYVVPRIGYNIEENKNSFNNSISLLNDSQFIKSDISSASIREMFNKNVRLDIKCRLSSEIMKYALTNQLYLT